MEGDTNISKFKLVTFIETEPILQRYDTNIDEYIKIANQLSKTSFLQVVITIVHSQYHSGFQF